MQITTRTRDAYQGIIASLAEPNHALDQEVQKTKTAFEVYKQQAEATIERLSRRNSALASELASVKAELKEMQEEKQNELAQRKVVIELIQNRKSPW